MVSQTAKLPPRPTAAPPPKAPRVLHLNPRVPVDLLCRTCSRRWSAWMPSWSIDPTTGQEHECISSNHEVILPREDNPE